MADDKLRDQVAKAVCSIAIGSERVETVMEIIQEHTAAVQAEAWDEGYEVGCADTPWEDGATDADRTPNPYREATP